MSQTPMASAKVCKFTIVGIYAHMASPPNPHDKTETATNCVSLAEIEFDVSKRLKQKYRAPRSSIPV